MPFRFENYTADELESCGLAFREAFEGSQVGTTPQWTFAVLEWFRQTAQSASRVFPPASDRNGEFLVDHCHLAAASIPQGCIEGGIDWWGDILRSPIEMMLALKSEWGSANQSSINLRRVMDDALKLAFVKARAKVLVFASRNAQNREAIVKAVADLRDCSKDGSPWLWLDVPWEYGRSSEAALAFGVLR